MNEVKKIEMERKIKNCVILIFAVITVVICDYQNITLDMVLDEEQFSRWIKFSLIFLLLFTIVIDFLQNLVLACLYMKGTRNKSYKQIYLKLTEIRAWKS